MKDLLEIIKSYKEAVATHSSAVLATIVYASGSTYRKAGAKALVLNDKTIKGVISGGCLEADILEEAEDIFQTGQAKLLKYDTTQAGDELWGLGLGCPGKIKILLEYLDEYNSGSVNYISECFRSRESAVIVTVYDDSESNQPAIQRCLFNHDLTSSGSAFIASMVDPDEINAVFSKSRSIHYQKEQYSFLLDIINIPVKLIIFGNGGDVIPVLNIASQLGWQISVVCNITEKITSVFLHYAEVIDKNEKDLSERLRIDEKTAIIIMSHHYLNDLEMLNLVLDSRAFYIATVGPKARTESLLKELQKKNHNYSNHKMVDRVYGPAGLDIGADSSEEIALAIIAEIQAVLSGCNGNSLRNKIRPVHAW